MASLTETPAHRDRGMVSFWVQQGDVDGDDNDRREVGGTDMRKGLMMVFKG